MSLVGKGKPPKDKRFQKGKSGNPAGARAHNQDLKKIRRLTHEQVAELGSLVLEGDLTALKKIKEEKKASVLKVWFASVAVKAIGKGDARALSTILDRIVGKPKEHLTLVGGSGGPVQFENLSDEDLVTQLKEIEKALDRK